MRISCRYVQGGKPVWTSLRRQHWNPLDSAILLGGDASPPLSWLDDSSCGTSVALLSFGFVASSARWPCGVRSTGDYIVLFYRRTHDINFHHNLVRQKSIKRLKLGRNSLIITNFTLSLLVSSVSFCFFPSLIIKMQINKKPSWLP